MNKKIKQLINPIKKYLIELYGDKIREIILYGSYARKENNNDSDIDILILTDETLDGTVVRKNISNLLYDILLEKGELVSVIVLTEYYFKNYNYPFILNVKKEGIKF